MVFNWKIYRLYNEDLIKAGLKTKKEYINHYVKYGKQEGRKCEMKDIYPEFNSILYRKNYDDLKNLSNEDLEYHWITLGIIEGRVYNKYLKRFFIISNIPLGGSVKYIKDLQDGFPKARIVLIRNKKELLGTKYEKEDVILLQQLLHSGINPVDIIELKIRIGLKMILCIHDFCWLNRELDKLEYINPHSRYLENVELLPSVKELFNIVDEVIHPSNFTYYVYSQYCDTRKFKIVPHNDTKVEYGIINIPKIENKTIHIGFLHDCLEVKGIDYIKNIALKYPSYKEYTIYYFVVNKNIKPYKESEFFDYIKSLNLHCLTYLNKWGETWSYSLTKGLNSGLPILYNNFGSFKERIPEMEHYFKVFESESEGEQYDKLYKRFEECIEYIIKNNGRTNTMNEDMTIEYSEYYKYLFME